MFYCLCWIVLIWRKKHEISISTINLNTDTNKRRHIKASGAMLSGDINFTLLLKRQPLNPYKSEEEDESQENKSRGCSWSDKRQTGEKSATKNPTVSQWATLNLTALWKISNDIKCMSWQFGNVEVFEILSVTFYPL